MRQEQTFSLHYKRYPLYLLATHYVLQPTVNIIRITISVNSLKARSLYTCFTVHSITCTEIQLVMNQCIQSFWLFHNEIISDVNSYLLPHIPHFLKWICHIEKGLSWCFFFIDMLSYFNFYRLWILWIKMLTYTRKKINSITIMSRS